MILFGSVNEAVFDWPWSVIHLGSGVVVGILLIFSLRFIKPKKFWSAGIGLLILWELFEMALRYLDLHAHDAVAELKAAVRGAAFDQESVVNTIGDLIIGTAGLAIGRRIRL